MAEQERNRIGLVPRLVGLLVAGAPVLQGAIATASGSPWLGAGLVASAPFVYRMVRTTSVKDADYRLPERSFFGIAKPLVSNLIGVAGAGTAMGYAVSGMAPMAVSVVAGALVSAAYGVSLTAQLVAHDIKEKEERELEALRARVSPAIRTPSPEPSPDPAPRADLSGLARAAAEARVSAKAPPVMSEASAATPTRPGARAIMNAVRPAPDLFRVPEHLRPAQSEGPFSGP